MRDRRRRKVSPGFTVISEKGRPHWPHELPNFLFFARVHFFLPAAGWRKRGQEKKPIPTARPSSACQDHMSQLDMPMAEVRLDMRLRPFTLSGMRRRQCFTNSREDHAATGQSRWSGSAGDTVALECLGHGLLLQEAITLTFSSEQPAGLRRTGFR